MGWCVLCIQCVFHVHMLVCVILNVAEALLNTQAMCHCYCYCLLNVIIFLFYLFFLKLETKYKFNMSDGFKCDVPFENLVEM